MFYVLICCIFTYEYVYYNQEKGCVYMEKFSLKKQEYANRTLRFPIELLDDLNHLASQTNMSLNHVVVKCCEYALENLENEPQK